MWADLTVDGHPEMAMREVVTDMLVIRGDNDFLTNLESMARLKAVNNKVNVMNVPFCEHVAFAEFPEVVLPSIGKFLGVDLK